MLRRGAPRTRGRGPHDDDLRRPRVLGCGHRRAGVEGKGRREAKRGCLRDRPMGRRADGHRGRAGSLSRPRRSSRLIGGRSQRSLPEPGVVGIRPRSRIRGSVPRAPDVVGNERIPRGPDRDLGGRRSGERLKAAHPFSSGMTEKRVLALLAMLIGLIAGLLILVNALDLGRGNLDLNRILNAGVAALLGIASLAEVRTSLCTTRNASLAPVSKFRQSVKYTSFAKSEKRGAGVAAAGPSI